MIRKFEFTTEELALEFIDAHLSRYERWCFIGPMRFATAWTEDANGDNTPTNFTGWMVDTDDITPLQNWEQYEVTPTNPIHVIWGRESEYKP